MSNVRVILSIHIVTESAKAFQSIDKLLTKFQQCSSSQHKLNSQTDQHQAQQPSEHGGGQVLGPGATEVAAYYDSQRHEDGNFEVEILSFVVGDKTEHPYRENRDQQRRALGAQLLKAENIEQRGDDECAAGTGESDQDSDHRAKENLEKGDHEG